MKQIWITRIIYFKCFFFFQLKQSFVFLYDFFLRCFVCVDFDPHISSLMQNCIFLQAAPQSLSSMSHPLPHPSCYSWCVDFQDTVSGRVCSYWCSLYLINLVTTNQSVSLASIPYLSTLVPREYFLRDCTKK